MSVNIYDVGDKVRSTIAFTKGVSTSADPTTVTYKIMDPLGKSETYVYGVDAEIIRLVAGKYYTLIDADEEGTWTHRWEGIGDVVAAAERKFVVQDSEFYPEA